jgi:hypothetical protein
MGAKHELHYIRNFFYSKQLQGIISNKNNVSPRQNVIQTIILILIFIYS